MSWLKKKLDVIKVDSSFFRILSFRSKTNHYFDDEIIIPLLPPSLLMGQHPAYSVGCTGSHALYVVNLSPVLWLLRRISEFDLRSAKAWVVQWIWPWPGSRRQTRSIRISVSGSETKKDKRIFQLAIKKKLQSCFEVNLSQSMKGFGERAIWRRVRGEPAVACQVLWSSLAAVMAELVKSHRFLFLWVLVRTNPSILGQASATVSF